MSFPTMPDPAADRAHEHARRHQDQETLEVATADAAKVLGEQHSATRAPAVCGDVAGRMALNRPAVP